MCCCRCRSGPDSGRLFGYTTDVWAVLHRVHDKEEETPAYDLCGPEPYGLEVYLRKWGQKKGYLT